MSRKSAATVLILLAALTLGGCVYGPGYGYGYGYGGPTYVGPPIVVRPGWGWWGWHGRGWGGGGWHGDGGWHP